MNPIKTIIVAAALSTLSGYAQAENLKPLQAVNFHTPSKDAVAYFLADRGSCKAVITTTDKTVYAPVRFEAAIKAHTTILHSVEDGEVFELACQADAQAMSINLRPTVAQH